MSHPPLVTATIIGVSLKMYFDQARALQWSAAVTQIARRHEAVQTGRAALFVLPSFLSIPDTIAAFDGTPVEVGAQDLFWKDRGPYTGEVSGTDLATAGCRYVEVGHAERRHLFGETDVVVAQKLLAAMRNGLTPVLCVGENAQISGSSAAAVCIAQLESALELARAAGTSGRIIVAYEPEWAIGAETSAAPEHIREVCSRIREWIATHSAVSGSSVIYGGSAGPGTLGTLGSDVDGLFLGRFAHDPQALEAVLDEVLAGGRAA